MHGQGHEPTLLERDRQEVNCSRKLLKKRLTKSMELQLQSGIDLIDVSNACAKAFARLMLRRSLDYP